MKAFFRKLVAAAYVYSGLYHLRMKWSDRRKVTILVYHDPSPAVLRNHLEYLASRFSFISMDTLSDAIRRQDWTGIPADSLVLTLDDGRRGNYDLLELFASFRVRPTVYLCSHVVDTSRHFWWTHAAAEDPSIKKYPYDDFVASLRAGDGFEPEKEYPDRQALSLAELREMSPRVDFGSHTRFHPVLTKCGEGTSSGEIAGSKESLERRLGRSIEHFAYPNGDYGAREIALLRRSGYGTGRTLDVGRNGPDADPYRLKAMAIDDDAPIVVLCAQLSGFFGYLKYVRYGSFRGMRPPAI